MPTYMGEEEVIKKNMALAQEQIYNVEYMEALPEDVRAELIDGRLYYMDQDAPAAGDVFVWKYLELYQGKELRLPGLPGAIGPVSG